MNNTGLLKKFTNVDTSNYPDFDNFSKPLGQGLWVLWVAKEELKIKRLSSDQIALIIVNVKETSIGTKSLVTSFNRAGKKIHRYKENNEIYYEIMKVGKEYLLSLVKTNKISTIYFEPDKRYTSKRLLLRTILNNLKGELRIVDPYCGMRTLDILSNIKNKVLFLTRLDNLRTKDKNSFLRDLKDFNPEHRNTEIRNYQYNDIHDRYIISSKSLIILGHSIKDLGNKESFAIVLYKHTSRNIFEALIENFNRRWKKASTI